MRQFPYEGGTFRDAEIGESGRQLMARQLSALSDDQLDSLFSGARFAEFRGGTGESADVHAWDAGPARQDSRHRRRAGVSELDRKPGYFFS
jgi:hypothetical protein